MLCRPSLQFRPALASVGLLKPRIRSEVAGLAASRIVTAFPCPRRSGTCPSLGGAPKDVASLLLKGNAHHTTFIKGKESSQGNAALRFESPTWVERASVQTPVIDLTKIRGIEAHGKERENAMHDLPTILAQIAPDTEILHITGDTPSNAEWDELGRHFTNLRALQVDTGFDECWIDHKFPLTWPLKLLVIASACGESITTPAILEGRIEHLVLFLTCTLRFEGPTTEELMKDAEVIHVIPRTPNPETEGETPKAEGDKSDGIKVYSVDNEWLKWLNRKYGGTNIAFSSECEGDPPSNMKKLEIFGNDAIEMLSTMAIARFHLLTGLESLTIHSSRRNDLHSTPADYFLGFLQVMEKLKELKLTLGSDVISKLVKATNDPNDLHLCLPPNLETLHFRGPASMAPHLDQFIAALADPKFLPSLKRISFVLDLPAADTKEVLSLEQLMTAKAACQRLLSAAANRSVLVDEFNDPWAGSHYVFSEVDSRWAEIGDGLGVDEGPQMCD